MAILEHSKLGRTLTSEMCKIVRVGSGEPHEHSRSLVKICGLYEEDIVRAGMRVPDGAGS